jgi:hypothetical protein
MLIFSILAVMMAWRLNWYRLLAFVWLRFKLANFSALSLGELSKGLPAFPWV